MVDELGRSGSSQQTPGQILKAARKASKISPNEVAQRLLLGKQVIAAIEEDDYSKIPAKVYAEGYLKAYAQFLQIPSDEVLNAFRALNIYPDDAPKKESEPQANKSLQAILKGKDGNPVILGIFGLFILAVIILLFMKNSWDKEPVVIEDGIVAETVDDNQLPIVTTTVVDSYVGSESKDDMSNDGSSDANKNRW